MNPYETRAFIVHRPGARVVDIYVERHAGSTGRQSLQLFRKEPGDDPEFVWFDTAEGAMTEPLMSLSDAVFDAVRSVLVGDKLEEREHLRGQIEVLTEALNIERGRVDRLLP